MSPHRTKWLWYALVMLVGPTCSSVRSVAVRTPPKTPATIEAQAKFFQDFFSVQLSPYKIEFGHVCEDPNTWEQRYERKDYKNHRDMGKVQPSCYFKPDASFFYLLWYRHLPTSEDYDQGHRLGSEKHFTERHEKARPSEGLFSAKVRWGDKKGGYGEHYWDLNHAGHADNHGHDDDYSPGSDDGYNVHEHDNTDSYDEPSEQSPNYENNKQSDNYENDNYDPEKASYEEANRAKRHPKTKADDNRDDYEVKRIKPRRRKHKSDNAASSRIIVEDVEENEKPRNEEYKNLQRKHKPALKELNLENDDNINTYTGTDQIVKATISEKQNQYTPQPETEPTRYVPYEAGAGVRQYRPPDVTPAASVPRLFLEPSTGHVIDRATGQAYLLQPIVTNNSYI